MLDKWSLTTTLTISCIDISLQLSSFSDVFVCLCASVFIDVSVCVFGTLTYVLWFPQEHMILCRFADQTAVSLPLERRLIGKMFGFLTGGGSYCDTVALGLEIPNRVRPYGYNFKL